jgi:hypothetical protein
MLLNQGIVTPDIKHWEYQGSGTEDDPYAVVWIENDPRNPMQFPVRYKWLIVLGAGSSILAVTLLSSAFEGGIS